MANDSTAYQFLTPSGAPVPYDDALLDLLQPIVAGIGGYPDPTLVRPRWQPGDTPQLPGYATDWCAVGVTITRPDLNVYEGHVPGLTGPGTDSVQFTEQLDVVLSCYGPNSQSFANRLIAGFKLSQNRAYLQAISADVWYVTDPTVVPALLTGVWVRRVDFTVNMRRYVTLSYNVETVLGGAMGLNNEQYITPITPNVP